jgi:hypothetical protein
MATQQEKDELMQVLKFTPRTYQVSMWGYGGEVVMGTVSREIYDYFKRRRLDVSDFAWNYDYAEENNIPEEMWPFTPGSWYECDNLAHTNGVDRDSGTIQIEDETGVTVLERALETIDGMDIQLSCDEEAWIEMVKPGEVVFIGRSNEKGTFFVGDIDLRMPFDQEKLCLNYDDIDGTDIVSSLYYDDEEIDNNDMTTDGKSSDFGFYLVKEGGGWEKYATMDDIDYELTDPFPDSVNPVYVGKYLVKTVEGYSYQALWNGTNWVNDWNEQPVEITQWQGITSDPEA